MKARSIVFCCLGRRRTDGGVTALASGSSPRGPEPGPVARATGVSGLGHHAHWLVVLIGGAVAATAAVWGRAIDRHLPLSAVLFTYGLAVTYAGLFILQFLDDDRWFLGGSDSAPVLRLLLLAILSLVLLLGAMVWALNGDNRPALWLAYTAFALEIFTLYVRTFGSLLNTSLFFLVAALIVSALAWLAYRLHRSKPQRRPPRDLTGKPHRRAHWRSLP